MDKEASLFKKSDIRPLLLIAVLLIVFAVFFFGMKYSSDRQYADISVDGVSQMRIDLYDGLKYSEIPFETQEYSFIIAYRDKSIRIKESNCKEQVCVHTGEIDTIGASIVCIPAKTVITIKGGDLKNDAVTY